MPRLTNTLRARINATLAKMLTEDDRIVLIGQSIRDPYGGACKVTRGLTPYAPSRVIDTPICEQAMIGYAIGMALSGYKPIVEIMFNDLLTLCVDQIWHVSHVLQLHGSCHRIVIRTMYNEDDKYGPTHSGYMYGLVKEIPGVAWMDVTADTDIEAIYPQAVDQRWGHHAVILCEHKQEYDRRS